MTELERLIDELTSGDEKRADAAARALAGFGEQAADMLQRLYDNPDADLRWWALRAAAEIHCEVSKSLLTGGLSDQDSSVRCCAALGLRHQPDPEAVPSLVELLGSTDKLLARLAADALASLGEQSVPSLLMVMENGSQGARLEAVRALAQIGDQRSVPTLFSALDEDSAIMEYWADKGLEKMGIGMVFYKP